MSRHTSSSLIVVVEDEEGLRCDIVEELQEAGYRTLAAREGQEALDLLVDTTPDLLLCDITMPGLDGYEVLRKLRIDRPDLSNTPFVFLTALSDPNEIIEGKLQGADDYLVKPVDYDLLLATVSARLRQVDRMRSRHEHEMAMLRQALGGLSGGGAEAALDLISLGIVLLDGRGKPVHVNRAAREMGTEPDFIRTRPDTINSPDPLSDRDLQNALSSTLKTAKTGGEKVVGVMLYRSQDDNSIPVLVCSLAVDQCATPDLPHVALFLSAPEHQKRVPETLLMDLFGLTPTEARVAGTLARSTRAADVASELGVTQTTISFHMRNLFQKTGTHRQADLIALILAGPMMIRSE